MFRIIETQGKLYDRGSKVLETLLKSKGLPMCTKSAVVLGLSPGNSYYSRSKVKELTAWSANTFHSVRVMVPAKPLVYCFQAAGSKKPEYHARKKARSLLLPVKEEKAVVIDDFTPTSPFFQHSFWFHNITNVNKLWNENAEFKTDVFLLTRRRTDSDRQRLSFGGTGHSAVVPNDS